MLNVALYELPRSGPEEMAPRRLRLRERQRHAVLKLVAETIGPARLIESRTCPNAAS